MTVSVPVEAIILAGGLGTRLRSVVRELPKPMAPVAGRPFLELLIDYWIEQGIQHFVLSVGYMADRIEEHFGNVYRGKRVSYIYEKTPLGTGGGVRQALLSTKWEKSHLLLVNGDTWYEASLSQLVTDASASIKPITMALKPMSANDRYGGVVINTLNCVIEFDTKNNGQCLVNGGCYLLDIDAVSQCLALYPEHFSLEQDFLVSQAREGNVAASIQDKTFLDIGIPADYATASQVVGVK